MIWTGDVDEEISMASIGGQSASSGDLVANNDLFYHVEVVSIWEAVLARSDCLYSHQTVACGWFSQRDVLIFVIVHDTLKTTLTTL